MGVLSVLAGRRRPPLVFPKEGYWPLDLPLVRFSKRAQDVWTLGDAVQGGGKDSGLCRIRQYLFSLLQELGAIENFPLTSEKRMG